MLFILFAIMLLTATTTTTTSKVIRIRSNPIQDIVRIENTIDLGSIINEGKVIHASYAPIHDWTQVLQTAANREIQRYQRHPELRAFYLKTYYPHVLKKYGSMGSLLRQRFGWSEVKHNSMIREEKPKQEHGKHYFTKDLEAEKYRITRNDWPYAFTEDINHYIVWSSVPLVAPGYLNGAQGESFIKNGMIGVTGNQSLKTNMKENEHEESNAIKEISEFVYLKWPEQHFETVFFINPTWKQTVPDIAHMHVLVRAKNSIVGDGSHALTEDNPF